MTTVDNYQFKGMPFSGHILIELAPKLFNGQLKESKTILEESIKYHLDNGGKKRVGKQRVTALLSNSLNTLKKNGLATTPSKGWWKIGTNNGATVEEEISEEIVENIIHDLTPTNEPEQKPDTVIGDGSKAVYVYYLPIYRHVAEQKKENVWQCKVGKTDGEPLQRILQQASTALPERPHIAIQIKTNLPHELEKAIHHILTLRGRKIDNLPGQEWFLTSPDEVLSIYDFVINGAK